MPGRPKKPRALEVAEGCPGHRKLNEAEPQPADWDESLTQQAPERFVPEERKVWKRLVKVLHDDMHVITVADHDGVAMLAALTRLREEAEDMVRRGDQFEDTPTGRKRSPAMRDYLDLVNLEMRAKSLFGLYPASRRNVSMVGGVSKRDEIDEALGV